MYISKLRELVEHTWGSTPTTPKAFEQLSQSIYSATHQQVSVSTLKRIWGYVPSAHEPRQDVLDILARYCGYSNLQSYLDATAGTPLTPESNLLAGEHVSGESIAAGRCVKAWWRPASHCVFRSLGHARFEVIESQGSKLPVGATFVCHEFIQHEPLYLVDLCLDANQQGLRYVCGRDTGVSFEV